MLLGNGTLFAKNPLRYWGQAAPGQERPTFNQSGPMRNWFAREGGATSREVKQASIPSGYIHPYTWLLPIQNGGLSSRSTSPITVTGTATMVTARPMTASATIDVTSSTPTLSLVSTMTADASFSITGTSALVGTVQMTAAATVTFTSAADVNAAAFSTASGTIDITGTATLRGIALMTASGTPFTDLSAEAFAFQLLDGQEVEAGITLRQALRLMGAVTFGPATVAGGTVQYSTPDGSQVRVQATLDGTGNRTSMVWNGD